MNVAHILAGNPGPVPAMTAAEQHDLTTRITLALIALHDSYRFKNTEPGPNYYRDSNGEYTPEYKEWLAQANNAIQFYLDHIDIEPSIMSVRELVTRRLPLRITGEMPAFNLFADRYRNFIVNEG